MTKEEKHGIMALMAVIGIVVFIALVASLPEYMAGRRRALIERRIEAEMFLMESAFEDIERFLDSFIHYPCKWEQNRRVRERLNVMYKKYDETYCDFEYRKETEERRIRAEVRNKYYDSEEYYSIIKRGVEKVKMHEANIEKLFTEPCAPDEDKYIPQCLHVWNARGSWRINLSKYENEIRDYEEKHQ